MPKTEPDNPMHIILNGNARELAEAATAQTLIDELDLAGRRIAVEINGEILPRSRYRDHRLAPGDRVEIVHAIGGG